MTEHIVPTYEGARGMPPAHPLATPIQNLKHKPVAAPPPVPTRVRMARILAFGGAIAMTIAGAYEMTEVVATGGVTVLEGVMTALFAVNFGWIAFAATSALAGLFVPPPPRRGADGAERLKSRTALVMPIYHEDPAETAAALEVMARGLAHAGQAHAFEIVMLSDSTSADAWIAETAAVDRLSGSLKEIMPVWYRRRWANTAKKAGNVRDFVEHWGGRYDYFVILDADSLMAPETLIALAGAMQSDPRLGILQTVPYLAGGSTVFARLQQFAGRLYGPVVARGLAAWQGGDGNYWGHNAIIRTSAFASCCGLPDLPGKQPLGGPILSHDFVEAALMRRAGWKVEMATDLGGSWEESPPSLIDAAVRDRRWAQGNLQHIKVIGAHGLAWPSRVHLGLGIMSYCASPIWLLLIGSGFALALQARLIRPEYFPESFQLFPVWPVFDSERMVRLFVVTLAVLFLPKTIGLFRALLLPELRRGCGGGLRLIGSAVAELLLSALYAPIMLVIHSRHVYEILTGRDSGWGPQRRDHGETLWIDAWRRHRWHMACGLGIAIVAWLISPMILAWLSPTLVGMLLAVPLSKLSGSARAGAALRHAGLLVTPEETRPPEILVEHAALPSRRERFQGDGVLALATDPAMRESHYRWASPAPRRRGAPDPAYLTAIQKIAEAETRDEALAWLDPRERVHVAGHRPLLEQMLRLPFANEVSEEPLPFPMVEPEPVPHEAPAERRVAVG